MVLIGDKNKAINNVTSHVSKDIYLTLFDAAKIKMTKILLQKSLIVNKLGKKLKML